MFRFSAKTRMSLGLVGLQSSLLLMASMTGLIPDPLATTLHGRTHLCEAIAVNSSILLSQQDHERVGTTLRTLVQRNPELLSAAIRKVDGEIALAVGDHAAHWQPLAENRSVETQVQVPLFAGSERWGEVELCFAPLYSPGWRGVLEVPLVRLLVVLGLVSLVVYWFYLRQMLQVLDPSKAVPDRVRSALDALAEGLLVLDHKGRIVLANHSFAEIVRQPPESLMGVVASSLPWLNEQEADCQVPFAWETVQKNGQSTVKQTLKMSTEASGTLTLAANAAPVLGNDGRCRGSLVSFDDVTVLETQKVELRRSKVVAEAANEAKTSFLANMSHEIRTPMNAILGYTDMLRRGMAASDQERDEHLSIIYTSGEHLLNLINDILDLSKIEAGRLEVEQTACQPYRIMREVVAVLQVRANEKGIRLQTALSGPIPATIQSDPTRLRQVLINLMGNAVKFTDQGSVSLVARLESDSSGPLLAIDVQDTGVGIAPEALQKIFDPFTQADHTVTRRFGGTGLGLTISRRLAEALGGTLSVRSEPGKGSTFTLTVATGSLDGVRLLNEPELRADPATEITSTNTSTALPKFTRGRVLVADDVDANRQLVCLILRRAGLEVVEAENGQIAVELATQQTFDVILMDMQMPVMDGYTATRQLRAQGLGLPIVAFTGSIMQSATDECFQAGCTEFLAKPVKLATLFALLARYLPTCGVLEPGDRGQETVPEDGHSCPSLGQATEEASGGCQSPEGQETEEASGGCQSPEGQEAGDRRQDVLESPAIARVDQPALARIASEPPALRDPNQALAMIDKMIRNLSRVTSAERRQDPGSTFGSGSVWVARPDHREGRGLGSSDSTPFDDSGTCHAAASFLKRPQHPSSGRRPEPLHCTLPLDDPEIYSAVTRYVVKLRQQVQAMRSACQRREFEEVSQLAHWLKGSGGTLGFAAFTAPAKTLETAANEGNAQRAEEALREIAELVAVINVPNATDALEAGDTSTNESAGAFIVTG